MKEEKRPVSPLNLPERPEVKQEAAIELHFLGGVTPNPIHSALGLQPFHNVIDVEFQEVKSQENQKTNDKT